jgi:hypothetical protein
MGAYYRLAWLTKGPGKVSPGSKAGGLNLWSGEILLCCSRYAQAHKITLTANATPSTGQGVSHGALLCTDKYPVHPENHIRK